MGKKKGTLKKRANIQKAKVNATTGDIKGRAAAFQEVYLLNDMKEAPKAKGYSIPRHAFLQSMTKEEMKYPHPDLFSPGEMKFRNTFGRWDPVRKKLPPLSQLLNRDLRAVVVSDPHKTEDSPCHQLSMDELRFLNYAHTEKMKRGGRGEEAVFDIKMLQEMDYNADEGGDEVSGKLSIPSHHRASMTRGRGNNSYDGRHECASTRRSSVGSMLSRQGSQLSLNSYESFSTYDPTQQHLSNHHQGCSASIDSQVSYSSFAPPIPRRSLSFVPIAGYPTIRDLYGDNSFVNNVELSGHDIESSVHDVPDAGHAAICISRGVDHVKEGEYDDDANFSTTSSYRSKPSSSSSLQQRMESIVNRATPVIHNRKALMEKNEETEYYDDQVRYSESESESEFVESLSTSSSFSSTSYLENNGHHGHPRSISSLEDNGRHVQPRSGSSHTSYLSDSLRTTRSDSDASYYSAQSDDHASFVNGNLDGSVASKDDMHYGVSTIPEDTSFDLHQEARMRVIAANTSEASVFGDLRLSSTELYLPDDETAEEAVAAHGGLEQGDVEIGRTVQNIQNETPSAASTIVTTDGVPANDFRSKDDSFGLLKDTPTSAPAHPGLKDRSRSIIVVEDSCPVLLDRTLSFNTCAEAGDKSQLPRGVAQLPLWWVATVPHEVIEEHSSDDSDNVDNQKKLKKKRMKRKYDVVDEILPVHKGREHAARPTCESITNIQRVGPPKADINIKKSSVSDLITAFVNNSTSTEISSIEQSSNMDGYRSEALTRIESIPENEENESPTVESDSPKVLRDIKIDECANVGVTATSTAAAVTSELSLIEQINNMPRNRSKASRAETIPENNQEDNSAEEINSRNVQAVGTKQPNLEVSIVQSSTVDEVTAIGAAVGTASIVFGSITTASTNDDNNDSFSHAHSQIDEKMEGDTNVVQADAEQLERDHEELESNNIIEPGMNISPRAEISADSPHRSAIMAESTRNYASQKMDSQAKTPAWHHVANGKTEKQKRAEDLLATIVDGSKASKQQDSIQNNSPENKKEHQEGAGSERCLFTSSAGTFIFFSAPKPEEAEPPPVVAKGLPIHGLQPLEDAIDKSPSLVAGPSDFYDDLEQRWQDAGACIDEQPRVGTSETLAAGAIFHEMHNTKKEGKLEEVTMSEEYVLSDENVKEMGEVTEVDHKLHAQIIDSSDEGSNRSIVESAEWTPSPGQIKMTQNKERRRGLGQRIMGGFQDEALDAHVRREEVIRSQTEKEPSLSIKKLGTPIRFNSSQKQGEDEGEGRRGLGQQYNSKSNGQKKTPWYRPFMSWKKQTTEKFEGRQGRAAGAYDDNSISVYSEQQVL